MIERILADFGPVAGRSDLIAVRVDPTWAADGGWPEGRPPEDPVEPGDVVATLLGGRHEFVARLDEGVEYACWVVADQLQDGVMDDLARPWPELEDSEGRIVGVLEPQFEPLMLAHWALRGAPFCAVGHLHDAVAAAGWRFVAS
ncbi:MAG: hypothetical protein HY241_07385 [Actinobacteria bacterium]|nr:hypothetical protein [Actinomycetota bacterium]